MNPGTGGPLPESEERLKELFLSRNLTIPKNLGKGDYLAKQLVATDGLKNGADIPSSTNYPYMNEIYPSLNFYKTEDKKRKFGRSNVSAEIKRQATYENLSKEDAI